MQGMSAQLALCCMQAGFVNSALPGGMIRELDLEKILDTTWASVPTLCPGGVCVSKVSAHDADHQGTTLHDLAERNQQPIQITCKHV